MSCTADAKCVYGYCDPFETICMPQKADGVRCTEDFECNSGSCTDFVCGESWC